MRQRSYYKYLTLYFFGGIGIALLGIAVLVGWYLQGWQPLRHRIISASMAPHFYGPHVSVICNDCEFPFACNMEAGACRVQPVCPNCGYTATSPTVTATWGDSISIVPWTMPRAEPQRWETVLYQHSANARELAVKRVVGLPGEQVAIHAGDLFVNGVRPERTLNQFRDSAILIYDGRYYPQRTDAPARWKPLQNKSHWHITPGKLLFKPTTTSSEPTWSELIADNGSIDWITYKHVDSSPDAIRGESEASIDDYLPYNQHLPARCHYVTDLMLRCYIKFSGNGWLACSLNHGDNVVLAQISLATRKIILVTPTGPVESEIDLRHQIGDETQVTLLEMAVYDRQAVVALNGITSHAVRLDDLTCKNPTSAQSLRLSAHAATIRITAFQILRDVYYLDPGGANQPWTLPRRLGPEEYFLLGDNPSISHDSRHHFDTWPVQRKLLHGKVLKINH